MEKNQGFSLTEALVSLLLITTISLNLLQQQWRNHQLLNDLNLRASALNDLNNLSERKMAGATDLTPIQPFHLDVNQHGRAVQLQLTWHSPSQPAIDLNRLKRNVFVP